MYILVITITKKMIVLLGCINVYMYTTIMYTKNETNNNYSNDNTHMYTTTKKHIKHKLF